MISHYALRLVCICLASFFLVNAAACLLTALASRVAIRIAESMRPRSAARFLFALRVFPSALGAAAVLGLCVPSYLWLEPQAASERIGVACMLLAILGAICWSSSLVRVSRALGASARLYRAWQLSGCETLLPGETANAVVVSNDAPLLTLVGVFYPRLVVSQSVLCSLSAEQLHLALQHENSHRSSRDNLKRLFLLLAPAPVPFFRGFSSFERHWARLSEWAADDEAVQGDSRRALSLADALLRLARLGEPPRLTFLHTAFLAADHDLSARVDRLLTVDPLPARTFSSARALAIGSGLAMSACVAVLLALPATLPPVHRLLELFLR